MKKYLKRKIIAGLLASVICTSSIYFPAYAHYTVSEESTYVFKNTTDLEADIDEGTGKLVLTWPAVDTEGQLVNENPLTSSDQECSDTVHNDPLAGWTSPTSGMILAYDGWLPDGTHNRVSEGKDVNHQVIKGIVDYETDYPIYVVDGKANNENASEKIIKKAYIDTTPVSQTIATAYNIEYSEDGVNWTLDHVENRFNHGKKLWRYVDVKNEETGETTQVLKQDNKNTFFLVDQLSSSIQSSLKPNTKYYFRVTAFDQTKPATANPGYKVFQTEATTPAEAELTPAFPTVEGGGTYSQGGRGTAARQGDVYIVTNLTDSVSDPQPGSFRYGLERRDRADGNKLYPRTIVFQVGGTINIDPKAGKSERRFNINGNTTIAGQTAPGDGITIAGGSVKFNGKNIIARYLKFRLGSGYDLDGGSASGENIVIDHCTFSYGVDETFSAKELVNSSVQYNIIDSGLNIPDKDGVNNTDAEIGADSAKHGMGSIMNGYDTSFTHNLWSNNGTRNPRFEGGFTYNNVRYENKLDFANNVVYNWGHGSAYGGARGNGLVNFENNYYKPGPSTLEKVKNVFYECYPESGYNNAQSSYYISGNVLEGNDECTADNTKGFKNLGNVGVKLDAHVDMKVPYTLQSAEEAYAAVIDGVGASAHRDAWDNRLIQQVINNTGYMVNSEKEAGGFDTNEYFYGDYDDGDSDGLPKEVEEAYGLSDGDPTDSTKIITDETSPYCGYTYLEVYINGLVNDWDKNPPEGIPARDALHITSVKDSKGSEVDLSVNADLKLGETYTLTCDDDPINSFAVYLNDRKVAEGTNGTATFTPDTIGSANLMVLSLGNTPPSYSYKIWSDAVRTTVYDADSAGGLLGDVNCDGEITSGDSALLLQYVLNPIMADITPQGMKNAQVKEGEINASFSAAILQKVLLSTFKFDTEGETAAAEGGVLEGFSAREVGTVRADGADFYNAAENTLITEGNGFIGRTGSNGGSLPENFHYNCKEFTGDVTITAKIYNWSKIDYYQFSGLMLRGSDNYASEFYAAGMTYLKDEDYDAAAGVNGKRFEGRNIISVCRDEDATNGGYITADFIDRSAGVPKYLGVPQARADQAQIGGWAKIVKEGKKVSTYASNDGETWYLMKTWENTTLPDTFLVGFATSSAQDTQSGITYNKSYMTDIAISNTAEYPEKTAN